MKRFLAIFCVLAIATGLFAAATGFAEESKPAEPKPAAADAPKAPAGEAAKQPAADQGTPTQEKAAAEKSPAKRAVAPPGSEVVTIAYLTQETDPGPARSNTQPIPNDEGLLGAELGIDDNNTTGVFTKQIFKLDAVTVPIKGDVVAPFKKFIAGGEKFIVLNLPAADVLKLADLPEAKDVMIFNAGAPDDRLRNADCRANVFHTLAERAMLADGLAQYLIKKKWTRWFLVSGQDEGDKLYADDIKRAAKKFGAKVVDEKAWSYTGADMRRSAESEIPTFTQGPDYHVLVVADEADNFGDDLMYRTWDPRPVAGTQGLVAADWHPAHEQWGATQMQHRFQKLSGRYMTSKDFAAWTAVRAVGEAATRAKTTDFNALRAFILGPDFTVGIFKGVGANFRDWDHQLREPILLATPYTVVSVSPQQEFIHPVSNLDTLGYDKAPESSCKFK